MSNPNENLNQGDAPERIEYLIGEIEKRGYKVTLENLSGGDNCPTDSEGEHGTGLPPSQAIAEIMEEHGFSEQYVDERLGRDASWPQIIEAVNYCLANACKEAYKMGWYERHNMTTIRAQTAGDYPQRAL